MKKYCFLLALAAIVMISCSSPEKPAEKTAEENMPTSVSEIPETKPQEVAIIETPANNPDTLSSAYRPSARAYQQEGHYNVYKGKIGSLPVTLHLIRSERYLGIDAELKEFIHGYYYYDKYQHPIHLVQYHPEQDQTALKGKVVLYERYQSMENPKLVGELDDYNNRFTGFWENDFTGKKLPFELIKEFNLMEAANLNEFHVGDYIELNSGNPESPKVACNLSMLFPSEYNDLEGVWESCYELIVPEMTGESARPYRDNPLEKLRNVRAEYLKKHLEKYPSEKDYYAHFNELSRYMSVLWNEDERICFGFFTHSYTGGAHGNHQTQYVNMNLRTGQILTLDHIFSEGYKKPLSEALERAARRTFKIPADQALTEVLTVEILQPTENFVLTNKGILFSYPPYELGPYSLGQVDLFVPFEEVKGYQKK